MNIIREKKTNFYKHSFIWNDNDYYIHFHADNLGRMQGGSPKDITNSFVKYRNIRKKEVGRAIKNQYNQLMAKDIGRSNPNLGVLTQKIYDNKFGFGDYFSETVDKVMKEELQTVVNTKALQTLMTSVENDKLKLSESGALLKDNLQKTGEELNKILTIIANVIDVLRDPEHSRTFQLGLAGKEIEGVQSLNDYSKLIKKKVEKIRRLSRNTAYNINITQINNLFDQLDMLINKLSIGVSAKKDPLSFSALKGIFDQNLLPKGLGETLGIDINKLTMSTLNHGMATALFVGQEKNYGIGFTTPDGKYITDEANITNSKMEYQEGKSDIRLENLWISLKDKKINKYTGEIKLSIGISNKFYKGNNFAWDPSTEEGFKGGGHFDLGGGIKLGRAIYMAFKKDRWRYLAYNTFAWSNEESSVAYNAIQSLRDIIFTRSIVDSFINRGGLNRIRPEQLDQTADFAGYLLLNDKIISTLDIIQYAIENNIGRISGGDNKVTNQGIVYTISGPITQYVTSRNTISMESRIKNTNLAINNANLTAEIRPSFLLNALKK